MIKLLLLLAIISNICSCSNGDDILATDGSKIELVPFRLVGPDNAEYKFEALAAHRRADNSVSVVAYTDIDSEKGFWALDIKLTDPKTQVTGDEIKCSHVSFSQPLSSNSHNYAYSYTGSIKFAASDGKYLLLRMENAKFRLADGDFTLNGHLKCKYESDR